MSGSDAYLRNVRRVINAVMRCCNPDDPAYKYYGGRGVCIHQPWLDEAYLFVEYIQQLPGSDDPKLWLDRIDNDGHYEPGNLHFVTPSQSAFNRGHGEMKPHAPMVIPERFTFRRPRQHVKQEETTRAVERPRMTDILPLKRKLTEEELQVLFGLWAGYSYGRIARMLRVRRPRVVHVANVASRKLRNGRASSGDSDAADSDKGGSQAVA